MLVLVGCRLAIQIYQGSVNLPKQERKIKLQLVLINMSSALIELDAKRVCFVEIFGAMRRKSQQNTRILEFGVTYPVFMLH